MNHEQQVLGSMLVSKAAVEDSTAILEGKDFAEPRNEVIFDAIVKVDSDGKPIDALSVHDQMVQSGVTDNHLPYLHELIGSVVSAASAGYHSGQVKAQSMRSSVRKAGSDLMWISEAEDPLEAVSAARSTLDAISDGRSEIVSNEVAMYRAIDSLSRSAGIPTPWNTLNEVISGWGPGMLYVVGARPGVGKSVFAVNTLLDVARRGSTAVMCSLEMPSDELYLRLASSVGNVNGDDIRHRRMSRMQDEQIAIAAGHISKLPIVVDDRTNLSIAQIRSLVRGIQRTREVGVLLIDYLTIMKPPADAPRNDRRVQVDAMAQGLKNLARDLGVPIVAFAQLNRENEKRVEKMPTLTDLRESGGIEAAADCVLLMHRTEDPGEEQNLYLVAAKNRHGPRGLIDLKFRGEFSRIEDWPSPYGGTQ